MHQLTVGDFKSKFSEIIQKVQQGEVFGVTYGKSKKRVGVFMPIDKFKSKMVRKLGILEGKASFKIHKGFKMTEEEFLEA